MVKPDLVPAAGIESYELREVSESSLSRRLQPEPDRDGQSAIERDAYDRGFAAGQRAGSEAGLKELDATRRLLTALLDELSTLKRELLATYEDDLTTIVFAVAGKVLGEELPRRPEVAATYVREAIAKLGGAGDIVIKVHPGDLDRLAREAEIFAHQSGQKPMLRFEADTRLAPGECVAETSQRTIEARIASQLAVLERAVRRGGHP